MQKLFCLVLLFIATNSLAQSDSLQARFVLIGDAGKLNYGRQPVIDAVRQLVTLDDKTTVLFLGDNLYKTNLPQDFLPGYREAKAILDSQLRVGENNKAKIIFMPGNHDWNDGGPEGWENVLRQQAYIHALGNERVRYLPAEGCPGPEKIDITDDIVLVLFDTQWFLQDGEKPGIESDCAYKTPEDVYSELDDIFSDNADKLVLLATHHTMKSYGIHGGYFRLKQHIFPFTDYNPDWWIPLPVIGTIYPIARGVFGTPEDLKHPAYASMIKKVEELIKGYPNIILAAGHEHNLQLIKDSSHYYIVSGAGSKKTRVAQNKKLLYGAASFGFATLDVYRNKDVQVNFYTVNEDTAGLAYSKRLLNYQSIIKKAADSTQIPESVPEVYFEDSVSVAVNKEYSKISGVRKLISGKNYRKEWATPVHLKVFRINKEMGGFKIKELGGGKQTKSLKLEDKDGREWTLRTVDKDPEGVVPEALKGSIAQNIVQDMTSAQHPFGALVIPPLADSLDVVTSDPKYFFVPDDPALGDYRQVFANKVCLLELREPTPDQTDTKSTSKVLTKMIEDSKNHVDQKKVLQARLLDMMIGDWDRHFDQWKFGTTDTGAGKLYYPVPRDRDQAFFYSEGLLAKAVSLAALPYLQGFKKNFPDINWFNWEERDFDRLFMNDLDATQWKNIIAAFQQKLTDAVIDDAVSKLPPEIYAIGGKTLAAKMKSRRDKLSEDGMHYYRFLAREVNIRGSNERELFEIKNAGDSLHIRVFKIRKKEEPAVSFDRTFHEKETRFINLYGLNDNDIFVVDEGANSKIKLRFIGGKGNDSFRINSNIRNAVYDYLPGKNVLEKGPRTKNLMSASPLVNQYDPTSFTYNSYRVPMLNLGYNDEDKLLVGVGFSLKTHGFRKEPYATYQQLSSLFSLSSEAYQVKYIGEFNQVILNKDLVVRGAFVNPVLNNFFGLGNTSEKNNELPLDYYHVRYKFVEGDIMLRKRYFKELLQIYLGGSFFHYWNKHADNQGKILDDPAAIGLDSLSVYSNKSYLGPKMEIVVNNLNSELLPSRGVIWTTTASSLFGMNKNSNDIAKITSDLKVFASLSEPAKLIAVLGVGFGHIFSNDYEYFQAMTLGANNHLRGFRKNRFAGQTSLYQTTEVRVKLFESHSYVVPGAVGLIAFNEIGRIWQGNERSRKWHHDFGGGLYYSPYNFAIVSATIAHSPEDNLFNISIGTKFNINF